MAEYRRLISYIYEYEGKTKGKNVGFVKLEARNGMCRLNVNVKKLYMGGGDMGVYLLTGRQEIFLGNIFLRNGCGEFRAIVQVADVERSGERMDECYGLTIHEKDDSWRSYTTIWEDAVAQAAQLTLESVTSDQLVEQQVERGKVPRMALDGPDASEESKMQTGPVEMPGQIPSEEPMGIPVEEPVGVPTEEPVHAPAEEPVHVPVEEPVRVPAEEPVRVPVEEPMQSPWEEPAHVPLQTPLEMPEGTFHRGQNGPSGRMPSSRPLRPWHEAAWRLGTPKAALHDRGNQQVDGKNGEMQKAEGQKTEGQKTDVPDFIPDFEMGQLEMETRNPDIPLLPRGGHLSMGQSKEKHQEDTLQPVENHQSTPTAEMSPAEEAPEKKDQPAQGPAAVRMEFSGEGKPDAGDAQGQQLEGERQGQQKMQQRPEQQEMQQRQQETQQRQEQMVQQGAVQKEERSPVIHQYREEPIIIGDPEALAKLDAEDESETQVPVWEFFSGSYPKIQAFDSEHGCQVLVIKPKDIGLLPRETWIYGNNSFLLHGYYNYRYLILARLENPKGHPRYILGVPGHYYSNEKYMASMFGFPHFVLSKKQSTKDGRFGYWYTDVRLEEEQAASMVKGK